MENMVSRKGVHLIRLSITYVIERGEVIMDNTKRVWYRVMDGENIVGYMFKAGQTCGYEERVVAVIAFPELYSEVNVVADSGAEYLNVSGGFHQDITIQQVSRIRGLLQP